MGRPRDAGDHQHHAAAGQDLRQRGHRQVLFFEADDDDVCETSYADKKPGSIRGRPGSRCRSSNPQGLALRRLVRPRVAARGTALRPSNQLSAPTQAATRHSSRRSGRQWPTPVSSALSRSLRPPRSGAADGAPGPGYWQQRVDYVIRATLDTAIARCVARSGSRTPTIPPIPCGICGSSWTRTCSTARAGARACSRSGAASAPAARRAG